MEIVKLEEVHIEALVDLEKLCFSEPWSEKSLRDQIGNPRACFLVAVEDDAVLGYGGMHIAADECYLDNIAVYRHHRNKGVGTAILGALVAEANRRSAAFVSLEVRQSNPAAALYRRLGFAEEGRRRNFYTAPMEDALILTKRLKTNDKPALKQGTP